MSEQPKPGFFASIADSFRKSKQFLHDRKQVKHLTGQKDGLAKDLDDLCLELGQRAQAAGAGKDLPAFADAAAAGEAVAAASASQSSKTAATALAREALQAEQTRREPLLKALREAHEKAALQARATGAELGSARKDLAAAQAEADRIRGEVSSVEAILARPLPSEPGSPPTPPPPAQGEQLLNVEAPEAPAGGPEAAPPSAPPPPSPAEVAYKHEMEQFQARVRAYEQARAQRDHASGQVLELREKLSQAEHRIEQARVKVPPLEQADASAQTEEKARAAEQTEAEKAWQQVRIELDGKVQAAAAEEKAAASAASAAQAQLKASLLALGRAVLEAGLSAPEIDELMTKGKATQDRMRELDQQIAALQADMDRLRGPFMRATFFTVAGVLLAAILIIGVAMLIRWVF